MFDGRWFGEVTKDAALTHAAARPDRPSGASLVADNAAGGG
jgi:hypothetical protein